MSPINVEQPAGSRIGVFRSALTGAAALGVLFILCWAGAVIFPTAVSHMFVALFTQAVFTTIAALVQGLGSALAFGALAGALVATFYNLFARFGS